MPSEASNGIVRVMAACDVPRSRKKRRYTRPFVKSGGLINPCGFEAEAANGAVGRDPREARKRSPMERKVEGKRVRGEKWEAKKRR